MKKNLAKTVDRRAMLWYLNNANDIRKNRICGSGSVVEHLLAKEKVAGSIPVSRSILSGQSASAEDALNG